MYALAVLILPTPCRIVIHVSHRFQFVMEAFADGICHPRRESARNIRLRIKPVSVVPLESTSGAASAGCGAGDAGRIFSSIVADQRWQPAGRRSLAKPLEVGYNIRRMTYTVTYNRGETPDNPGIKLMTRETV
jgi:hypothetical protein